MEEGTNLRETVEKFREETITLIQDGLNFLATVIKIVSYWLC